MVSGPKELKIATRLRDNLIAYKPKLVEIKCDYENYDCTWTVVPAVMSFITVIVSMFLVACLQHNFGWLLGTISVTQSILFVLIIIGQDARSRSMTPISELTRYVNNFDKYIDSLNKAIDSKIVDMQSLMIIRRETVQMIKNAAKWSPNHSPLLELVEVHFKPIDVPAVNVK